MARQIKNIAVASIRIADLIITAFLVIILNWIKV